MLKVAEFQFLLGTLITVMAYNTAEMLREFQFLLGTLITRLHLLQQSQLAGFNSS